MTAPSVLSPVPSAAPSAVRSAARPPLGAAGLAALTRRFTDRLHAGEFGAVRYGDPGRPDDPAARWHVRVHADDVVDVWLISWLPSQGTRLHDHGGSSGAFTVVRGELAEAVWRSRGRHPRSGRLRDRRRRTGATVAFGGDRVHDVRNLAAGPAVSVHAYSPPLTTMNYYDVERSSLRHATRVTTTDPEAEA